MKRVFGIALVLALAMMMCFSTVALANDEQSSSMHFEGLIEDWGDGEYHGTAPMTQGVYYVPGGLGEAIFTDGGFDVYALEGGTTYVEGMIPDSWVIGSDHDAYSQSGPWGSWYDPDCADWNQYSLDIDGTTWALRYTATGESPMSGIINLDDMYAYETDPGTVKGVHGGSTTDPTEYSAGSAQEWGWHCGWGEERIPLEYPGFTITVTYLGDGIYKIVMTPASAPPPPTVAVPGAAGGGTPWSALNGKFAVGICAGTYAKITAVNWVEGWQGKTLKEELVEVGTFYYNSPTTYKLVIPAGTVVEPYYGLCPVRTLTMHIAEGEFYFDPNLKLSQVATLYELVDGEWVEVLKFDQVLNHKASLSVSTEAVGVSD